MLQATFIRDDHHSVQGRHETGPEPLAERSESGLLLFKYHFLFCLQIGSDRDFFVNFVNKPLI